MIADAETRPKLRGFIRLGAAVALLWGITVYAAPALINAVPIWKSMGEAADRLDINAGSIFYTDVPVSGEAELHMRSTITYRPGGK
jgi:hypothetical protein